MNDTYDDVSKPLTEEVKQEVIPEPKMETQETGWVGEQELPADWEQPVVEVEGLNSEEKVSKPKAKRQKQKAKANGKAKGVRKAKTAKKPAKEAKVDRYGFREGTARSIAAAMYSAPKGATLAEVKAKTGTVQYNILNELRAKGYKVTTKEVAGQANRPATRYHLSARKH